LVVVTLFAFLGPAVWPYEPGEIYAEGRQVVAGRRVDAPSLHAPAPRCTGGAGLDEVPERFLDDPCAPHLLGTDTAGHDMVAQLMRGTQRSLAIAFAAAAGSTAIGVLIGAVAGYYRGWIDSILMRTTDLFLTVPAIAVAGTLSHHVQGGRWWLLAVILAGLGWTFIARLVRAEVLFLREREFVEAARALGSGHGRIIVRHILPNLLGPIIVSATLVVAGAILAETSLSYLGIGVTSPDTSLGLLISTNQAGFQTRPWLFWCPGLLILAIALSINFIGDGLRDAFDPKQRTRR
jgi:peptide/nickel transport system permease protein